MTSLIGLVSLLHNNVLCQLQTDLLFHQKCMNKYSMNTKGEHLIMQGLVETADSQAYTVLEAINRDR